MKVITANANTSMLNISLTIKYCVTHLRKKPSVSGVPEYGKGEVDHVGGKTKVAAVCREIVSGKIILDSAANVKVYL